MEKKIEAEEKKAGEKPKLAKKVKSQEDLAKESSERTASEAKDRADKAELALEKLQKKFDGQAAVPLRLCNDLSDLLQTLYRSSDNVSERVILKDLREDLLEAMVK